jgi:riboflavin kinase/FMN adenylyltransferase
LEIYGELKEIPNLSLALGFFDGLHLGHQAVISCAVDFARNNGKKSAMITFKSHPSHVLSDNPVKYIIRKSEKYEMLEELGLDYVIELDFEKVYKMSPQEYLKDVLVKYFSPVAISTGFNHKFGADQSGNVRFLADNQVVYNYLYFGTPHQDVYGQIISSSAIRRAISNGDFYLVSSMLGRKFNVRAEVVHGNHLGRTIGYPTANIVYPDVLVPPKYGVYDVSVQLSDGRMYRGLANFGVKPTVSESLDTPILEIYLLDFDGDLYGQTINVEFTKFIRLERKFASLEELKSQIDQDLRNLILL